MADVSPDFRAGWLMALRTLAARLEEEILAADIARKMASDGPPKEKSPAP